MKKKIGKIAGILAFGVVFCCVLISLAQATDQTAGRNWANNNLENKNKAVSIPVWKITRDGRANSVRWVDHGPNPRFAIYDVDDDNSGGDQYYIEDLVLDKETGLIWTRDADLTEEGWQAAISFCRSYSGGHRRGWRLPTIEEISTLLDTSRYYPALPEGHPFINMQYYFYWSSTTYESNNDRAWAVLMLDGRMSFGDKSGDLELHVWPVRGGNGYATGNW